MKIEEEDFDDYAEEFEEHLVNVLEYRLPQVGLTPDIDEGC